MKRALVVGGVMAAVLLPTAHALAHPLGNFTVNHYDGLTVTPHSVTDQAVVDFAEIPTAQARSSVDTNGDGTVQPAEASSYAAVTCAGVARNVSLVVSGRSATWQVRSSSFAYRPGAAGLQTSRLECALVTTAAVTSRTQLSLSDAFESDRIGWHEVTAVGQGVHFHNAPVPARSISDELRHYPNDLLSSPLDVRSAQLTVLPGAGASTLAPHLPGVHGANAVARGVEGLFRLLSSLAGSRHLTVGVGMLAVLVSLLLGAAHAALPGHGKTVMAAYLAGRHGTRRDAVMVGATVTLTHTAGVLALGLALSLSSSLAGEQVSSELGVVSGAVIVAVGVGLLLTAVRQRRDHKHAHHHEHGPHAEHSHHHEHHPRPLRRRATLIGMGIAGGLVPSPSALVVLLGAVALGRTAFGVVLVLAYGAGMAATLTAAGLLLVNATDRFGSRPQLRALAQRAARFAPATTSVLVVAVGAGLATRSLLALSL